jgi:YggT family protein
MPLIITEIAELIIKTLGDLLVLVLLLRFLLQALRVPWRNPVSYFVAALTNWAVLPLRRVIPGFRGIELAPLVVAWVVQTLLIIALAMLRNRLGANALSGAVIGTAVLLAVVELLKWCLYIGMFAVIVQAVLSWFNSNSPFAPVLDAFTRPLLRPFRRLIPPLGNIDLSPIFAILALQIGIMLLDKIT